LFHSFFRAFVPLYVASYFFERGLCDPSSPDELKQVCLDPPYKETYNLESPSYYISSDYILHPSCPPLQSCHEAYALASAISGVTQLIALLSGVAFVWVTRLSRTLALTSLLGCLSFTILGRSAFGPALGGADPENIGTWIASLGIGIAQTGSVTVSLALIAKERAKMQDLRESVEREDDEFEDGYRVDEETVESALKNSSHEGETAGALAGAYSFCGGKRLLLHPTLPRLSVYFLRAILTYLYM